MTDDTHTPAPWHVSTHGVPDGIYQAGIYAEGDDRDLATITSSEADAMLLAAAPELLQACRDALAYIGERTTGKAQDTLRAAIASATARP